MNEIERTVVIALGSNRAGPYTNLAALLEAAQRRLIYYPLNLIGISSWWRSKAWPDPSDPAFLNGVMLASTRLSAEDLLSRLHESERQFGRQRSQKNAPRTLDLDLITYGDVVRQSPDLCLPHPRAMERLFVMGPLSEIAPKMIWPGTCDLVEDLVAHCTVGLDALPLGAASNDD